jgi:hypothetical protein
MEITITKIGITLLIYFSLSYFGLGQKIVSVPSLASLTFIFDFNKITEENANSTMQFIDIEENRVFFSESIENLYKTSQNGLKRISIYNY